MKLTHMIAAASMAFCGSLSSLAAQDYPGEPIQIVVPNAAGGSTDVLVRLLQPHIEAAIDGTLVVINVPGSGSVGGSRRVVEAAPDGYTVLVNHLTLLSAMALGTADFGPDAFTLAATSVELPLVVVVPSDSPVNTLDELMALARDSSDPVIAGVNIGAINHFSLMMVQSVAENPGEFRYVQTGGGADTTAALLGRHINVGVLSGAEARPVVDSGDVRVIAVLSDEPVPYFPGVETAKAQGYDMSLGLEYYWLMPAGTPQDRADKFAAALESALQVPEVREALDRQGMVPTFGNGPDTLGKLDANFDRLKALVATLK